MAICLPCSAGMHEECEPTENVDILDACCCPEETTISFTGISQSGERDFDKTLKDPQSTGRKEAARLWPIIDAMVCEWSNLARAGGGVIPIVGCNGSVLYTTKGLGAIHHGPDKNTLNNSRENIHRICPTCHNRWHALNDPFYGERPEHHMPFIPLSGGEVLPHDAETFASPEQKETNNKYWSLPDKVRATVDYRELMNSVGRGN